ncbi:MAG TPA: complex I NDUFA9 subunit family protein [Verrucomicrobiae bacterium]|nr:complex I NDUFA9 subunit family protein [Verrucomicrobiae bacterium]
MKVFVTGASGFVGEEILRQLHAAGYGIRILARKEKSSAVQSAAARFKVEIHPGDVTDAQTLFGALIGCDAVIHLVGIISEVGKSTYENIHTRGTQNMVGAAQPAGVRRFIHMSALGTRPNAVARYHQSKWAAEEILRHSGLDFTIFRPSIIYGPHDHFVNLFASLSRFSPVLPVIGDGRAKLQPVPVADVAKCFVSALSEPKSIGQTFDLAGRDVLSFEQVLDTILEVTHRKRWKMHVPLAIARLQATLLEKVFPLFGKAPPFNRDQLLMLQEDNVGDAKCAMELFSINGVSFKDGIAGYLHSSN